MEHEKEIVQHEGWKGAYHSALLETDNTVLYKRIETAENALLIEQQAIADALSTLRLLKRERGYPPPSDIPHMGPFENLM